MTPILTDEQRQAVEEGRGAPVYVEDAKTKAAYVLISAEAFQRIRAVFGDEDPFDISQTYVMQDDIAARAWSDPRDAEYDNYDAHRNKP